MYYLERILYGTAKAITEHIKLGDTYGDIKKVYSISIVYFDLGKGADYLYHGISQFVGVHTNDTLRINVKEEGVIRMKTPEELFPEYFIIRVNEFNKIATTPLEEWMDYLKNGHIKDDTSAPGLAEAREKLQYMMMNDGDRHAYDEHLNAIMIQNDVLSTAREEGLAQGKEEGRAEGRAEGIAEGRAEGIAEGRAEGRAEGIAEGKTEVARKLKAMGVSAEGIMEATGLSREDIEAL
jgi:hypothetical protein